MFDNVMEVVVEGAKEHYLNIPIDEFFFSYDTLNHKNANDFVKTYFEFKSKDGIFKIKDLNVDNSVNMIKITLEVDYNKNLIEQGYTIPDVIENANLSKVNINE